MRAAFLPGTHGTRHTLLLCVCVCVCVYKQNAEMFYMHTMILTMGARDERRWDWRSKLSLSRISASTSACTACLSSTSQTACGLVTKRDICAPVDVARFMRRCASRRHNCALRSTAIHHNQNNIIKHHGRFIGRTRALFVYNMI